MISNESNIMHFNNPRNEFIIDNEFSLSPFQIHLYISFFFISFCNLIGYFNQI